MNPTKAEADAVARALLATVEDPSPRWTGQQPPAGFRRSFAFVKREIDYGAKPEGGILDGPLLNGGGERGPETTIPFLRPIPKLELGRLMDAALQIAARRMRTYPDGCICPKLPANGTPQTYNLDCPIKGHQRLALAARHRRC